MCAQKVRTGEPYKLAGSRLVFTNWYYIRPGSFGWFNKHGKNVSVMGDEGPFEADIRLYNEARGISISVRQAERCGPVLVPEKPWESEGVNLCTVIKDGSIYKGWGSTAWGDLNLGKGKRGSRMLCYYESEDGMNWKRPNCGIVEYDGNTNNNIVSILPGNYHNLWGSVFIDEFCNDSEKYKFIVSDGFTEEECRQYFLRRPGEADPNYIRKDANLLIGVRGAVSPDGLRWRVISEPLVLMHEDGPEAAYYDTVSKKYVAFWRDWMAGPQAEEFQDSNGIRWLNHARRAIGRSETDDFYNFPLSSVVLEPGPDLTPNQVYYSQCKTTIPNAPDNHLLFPGVWDTVNDATFLELAASHDSKSWHKISKNPVLETSTFGHWDGGCIFAVPNLFELPNGDFALPYVGFDVPHKYPRVKAKKATGYAIWPKGRIVALEAQAEGCFTTVCIIPPGKRLLMNAVTKRAGYIRVEALDADGNILPGHDFENFIPIIGDQYMVPVEWNNSSDLGIKPGEAVSLRFRMKEACIYCLDFV